MYCIDIVLFILLINNEFRVPIFEGLNIKNVIAVLLIVLIVYWLFFIVFKIHKSLWKYIGPVETMRIGFAVICSTIVLGAGFYCYRQIDFFFKCHCDWWFIECYVDVCT